MWMQVLFDLPVTTKGARTEATRFRSQLLDFGFEMSQYSVYQRFFRSKEQCETTAQKIERVLPSAGRVHLLIFTDKQYEGMKTFVGAQFVRKKRENKDQFELF
jgi:CRISPR-associated protein Cas2